jgi:ribosome-binding factor A
MVRFLLSDHVMRMGKTRWLVIATLGGIVACGADDEGAPGSDGFNRGSGDPSDPGAGSGGTFGAGGSGGAGELPPEVELSEDFELPHAGDNYVYVANPETDNVAVINAATLGIHIVEAGDEPTFLQTLAGRDAAIVLNVGSADATVIRTENGGSVATKVRVQRGSNAIAVSPDGAHAVVYYDPNFAPAGEQQGSFQDVSVLALNDAGDASYPMTVGFRPSAIFFQSDGSRAFAVTEDGVSILDFGVLAAGGSGIARTVPLGIVGTDLTLDVSVTPDGRYALAREESSSLLRLVDLDDGSIRTLDLAVFAPSPEDDGGVTEPPPSDDGGTVTPEAGIPPVPVNDASPPPPDSGNQPPTDSGTAMDSGTSGDGGTTFALTTPLPGHVTLQAMAIAVTDLDLAPSGEYALAVVRDTSTLLRIPIPGAFEDSSLVRADGIDGELVGSVTMSSDGRRALLFTTVVDANERITIFDLAANTHRSVQLRKSVRSVAISPDGEKALVIHRKLAGAPDEPGLALDDQIDRSYGYSLLELSSGFAKLEVTPADLGPFAIVPDGSHLFVLFDDGATREVQRANLSSFFVDRFTLGSPPVSVGPVPASRRVFVGQEHPDGRIAFIDWVTGDVQSVTGFELNSRIRE